MFGIQLEGDPTSLGFSKEGFLVLEISPCEEDLLRDGLMVGTDTSVGWGDSVKWIEPVLFYSNKYKKTFMHTDIHTHIHTYIHT